MLSYLLNTLIFVIVGIIIAERIELGYLSQWLALAGLYVSLQMIRALSVILLLPVLARIGIGIDRRKTTVLIWSGLRGAVALSLALAVAQNPNVPADIGEQILFLTAGIVALSIVINGALMRSLLVWLELDQLPAAKQATMARARILVSLQVDELKHKLMRTGLYNRTQWSKVDACLMSNRHVAQAQSVAPGDLGVAFRRQLLEAEREYYWQQYRSGLIGRVVVGYLLKAVESALDGLPVISPRAALKAYWLRSALLDKSVRRLKTVISKDQIYQRSLVYSTTRTFVGAQYLIRGLARELAPNDALSQEVQTEIDLNIYQGEAQVESLLLTHGDVVGVIETHIASRLLLNREREVLRSLAESGVLEGSEADKLIEEIEVSMARLQQEG
jgi:NhaP-type Na+/H+ or K+/H+ antiporter